MQHLYLIMILVATCADPTNPVNGYLDDTDRPKFNGSYLEGTQAIFRCDLTIYTISSDHIVCDENGNWSPNYTCIGNNNHMC